jgi:hypothetical protein
MGEGMKRIAEAYGGMRVSARGGTCDYVAKKGDYKRVIQQRERQGWFYYGTTEDGKFLQFTMPTAEVEKHGL